MIMKKAKSSEWAEKYPERAVAGSVDNGDEREVIRESAAKLVKKYEAAK